MLPSQYVEQGLRNGQVLFVSHQSTAAAVTILLSALQAEDIN